MELSITAVTANRSLGKALVRNRVRIDLLRHAFEDAKFTNLDFRVFQLVLNDRTKGTATVSNKEPSDCIYQVLVGVGGANFMALTEDEFAEEIACACRTAVRVARLDDRSRATMLDCLARVSE